MLIEQRYRWRAERRVGRLDDSANGRIRRVGDVQVVGAVHSQP